jgi:pimeloyl-ACP methyl ester carboxylesterase
MVAFIDVDGFRTAYEVEGDGPALLLLHGGLGSADDWGAQRHALAEGYGVYIPERRGHGRTPDREGPITYEGMAADTEGFMTAAAVGPAHLVGWSDGALVALHVALRRPDLVHKLVLIGQYVNKQGEQPWFGEYAAAATPDTVPSMFREQYAARSSDGAAHFPIFCEKLLHLWRTQPNLPLETLRDVRAPTLILVGDDDIVTTEHAVAMAATIPDAQLAVVPGASHTVPIERPELVNRILLDFLAPDPPPKYFMRDRLRPA